MSQLIETAQAILYNEKTGEVKAGQVEAPRGFTHWLMKFDGVSDSEIGITKGYGRVEMAYHLMAKAAGIEMMECRLYEEKGRAHFMTRRFDRVGNKQKLHVQSFCALNHFDFNLVNDFSYEQLFGRMSFNVIAPAFHICHAYRPESNWVSQHALSVNGKRSYITRDDLLAVAKNMNIKKAPAILNQIKETVASWKNYAAETKVAPKLGDAIGQTFILL